MNAKQKPFRIVKCRTTRLLTPIASSAITAYTPVQYFVQQCERAREIVLREVEIEGGGGGEVNEECRGWSPGEKGPELIKEFLWFKGHRCVWSLVGRGRHT